MSIHPRVLLALALSFVFCAFVSVQADDMMMNQAMGHNMKEMKFGQLPILPTCATVSVQNGDPSKEPSVILAKVAKGCSIPWHWHTANENLMIVSGVASVGTRDGKPMMLSAGGFARMPSKMVHQFSCSQACSFYIASDAAFDLHYVDAQGTEMTPADALKVVKEVPGAAMK